MTRCFGNGPDQQLYAAYHDQEWAVPSHDDTHLFAHLILGGAQAGLSWETVLKKREGYRKAFYQFDPSKVAAMTDEELEGLRDNPSIIRNRLKIYSARQNAQVFLKIQKEFGSFAHYIWGFVSHKTVVNYPKTAKEIPCTSEVSDALSKDLKKRGMTFVGSTIVYAYMQAVGLVNDHIVTCRCK